MDNYGCCKVTLDDASMVRRNLEETGSVVFPLSGDQIGCLIILLSKNFDKIGVMPYGGNPHNRIYVGVYGRGCNHLSKDDIHPGYIEEKLGITLEEAEWFSTFWKMMWQSK